MAAAPQLEVIQAPDKPKTIDIGPKKRIGNLTDDMIVEQIRRLRQESIDSNRLIMNTALECWEQYRNRQNFDDKASWESRITLAKGHAAVKHAVANIMRLLTQNEQWLTVEDISRQEPTFAPFVEKGVLRIADIVNYKETLRDALEFSFATMFGAMKILWEFRPDEDVSVEAGPQGQMLRRTTRMVGSLGLSSLDPWKVHHGPRTVGGRDIDYIVEDSDADLAELKQVARFENLNQFNDRDQRPKEADLTSTEDQRKDKRDTKDSRVRKRIELWEYWGDLIDPQTQEVVARDMHIVVGNGEKVILFEENPLWDRKAPYILFSPLIVAGRFPGGGILEMNLEVKRAIDRLAQMWEDHLRFSVLPMWEAELAALENPEDVATGVYPGKVFRKKMGQGPNQVFRPLVVPPITADAFNAVIAYDKEYQRGTFITEQTQGLIDARGETTATEVQQTAIASTLILSDIAQHLEQQLLAPLGECIWDRMFQFMDVTSFPNWENIIGPDGRFLDMMPLQFRMEIVKGDYIFKARGLSRAIERQAMRQSLIDWIRMVAQLGPAQAIINIPELITRVHESFHLPEPEKLLAPNWQMVFQQFQAAQLAQANPVVQMEARGAQENQRAANKMAQTEQEKELEGRNAILLEAAKASLNPKSKEKSNE